MVQPLALVVYENVLLGNQLVNRLRDLGYRVQVVEDAEQLPKRASLDHPLLILADLDGQKSNILSVIEQIRQAESTGHIPILGFTGREPASPQANGGATLVASEKAILSQLPQLLDQVLQVD